MFALFTARRFAPMRGFRPSSLPSLWFVLALSFGTVGCSKDRNRMIAPPDPMADHHQADNHDDSHDDSHDHEDDPISAATPSDETVADNAQEAPSGGETVAPATSIFTSQVCESIFTKAAQVLSDHAIYSNFTDLSTPWNQRMCEQWVHGFDSYQLYWSASEANQLINTCAQTINLDFQQANCQALERVPAAWITKRKLIATELDKLISHNFQLGQAGLLPQDELAPQLALRTRKAIQHDQWLLEAIGAAGDGEPTWLTAEFKAMLSAHKDYGTQDLAELTLRAFVNSLDPGSAYGLGKYGSAHATLPERFITLAHREPIKLVQFGSAWIASHPKPAAAMVSTTAADAVATAEDTQESTGGEPAGAAEYTISSGDRLIGIYDGTSKAIQSERSFAPYLPAHFLDTRTHDLTGALLELEFKHLEAGGMSTTYRLPLLPEHEDEDDTVELHPALYTFEDITKGLPATIATLKLEHFHSHDGGLSQLTALTRELIRLKDSDVHGLVIDLRGNHHGNFQDAAAAISLFLAPDAPAHQSSWLLYHTAKTSYIPFDNYKYQATTPPLIAWDNPVIVLVDPTTGGASEFFAQALKKYADALIVGGPFTEGAGSQQTYIAPDELWDGYFVTTRTFGLGDGSTWNCWGLGIDIPWQTQSSTVYHHQVAACPKPLRQHVAQSSHRDKDLLRQLARNSYLRHNLYNNHLPPHLDADLLRATLIAVDEYFLTREAAGLSGRYKLISATTLSDPGSEATILYEATEAASEATTEDLSAITPPAALPPPHELHSASRGLQFSQPVHAYRSHEPRYSLVIDDHHTLKVCTHSTAPLMPEDAEPHDRDCTPAFADVHGNRFHLPEDFYTNYTIDHAETDAQNFLHLIHINNEERRLFFKSMGMGLTGGAFSGGSAASPGVLGGIAGATVLDSTMDATAGVPGHVDEKIGVPRVAVITSAGTASGSIIGVLGVIYASKATSTALTKIGTPVSLSLATKVPLVRRIIGGIIVLTGVHMAFFSDANSLAELPWHPFHWFAEAIWEDPSLELAQAWPHMVQGQVSSLMTQQELVDALTSLRSLLISREFALARDLSTYCLPHQRCVPAL